MTIKLKQEWVAEREGWACNTYSDTKDNSYGRTFLVLRTMVKSPTWLWVAVRLDGSIMIVDGNKGDCGEEPDVVGPFKSVSAAMDAVTILQGMDIDFSDVLSLTGERDEGT